MSIRSIARHQKRLAALSAPATPGRQFAVAGIMAVILLVVGLAVLFVNQAAAPPPVASAAIVGKWVNSEGGVMQFNADGTGSIPGFAGQGLTIPAAAFTYNFPDPTHLKLTVNEQTFVIEIKLEGDQLIWIADRANNIQHVYTRAK